ncbi:hypothetical protein L1049_020906 [Liquidambar formosana]|uniref:AAA+ ATPase domain-containing protein n=1 Tax=Liquidambar formosana TaxID=63359 RepID=A0AAP0SDR8_LIQFO
MENQKIILATASKAAKCLVAPIERQLDYLLNYHSNVEDLKIQLKMLGDVKGGVDQSVDIATRNGEDIEPDIEKWLESVSRINEVARKFLDDERNAKKWYFNRLCPNLKSRYQLSKKAKKTAAEVFEIQDSGIFYTTKGYEAFESRMSTLKGIMEALTSIDIQIIGIYGIGGVGKTMLAKEVGKKSKEDQLFDEVVIVDISRTPNIKKIQGEIANVLGLKFDQETEPERAYRLCQRLGEVRILVILDDIWARLDLKAVGIPFKDEHEGKDIYEEGKDALKCKVVVISRNQDALRSDKMAAQMNFLVEVLPEKEAWNFFKKMAGDGVFLI